MIMKALSNGCGDVYFVESGCGQADEDAVSMSWCVWVVWA